MILVVILTLTVLQQRVSATSRFRSRECSDPSFACRYKFTVKPLDMEEEYPDPPPDSYDYDFYRKHGDVPSPGVGH
ncbi:putative Transmembrane protein [Quillaja saponaria]|uniref:Transmembrane protein n=1 Tax=Quillaja saponaria TaxID=32244 RepID=A0AAD7LVN2_QUISA|nr:putative Transmembrane protein [Quillaja saponaria]